MSNEQHRNALAPGHRLHWYLVERVLGQGGFGITYLARDENLDQAVAIKEYLPSEIAVRSQDGSIQPRSGADAEHYRWGMERFLSEARTLARFNHTNIIQVFSVFEANHTAYMVMRYEEGESLRAILKQRKHLSEPELLGICLPICDGLAKVHAAGFIHRDIQPSNIYIRDDGSPVLLDFGAARRTMGNPRTLTILVAPGYAPIEQYYSSGAEQGPWTDIYGLGATLYRAVTGAAPIDAIERSRGMLGSSRDMLVPAAVVGDGRYSANFLQAIDHALRFNDRDRPREIRVWVAELRGESPVPESPPPAAPPHAGTTAAAVGAGSVTPPRPPAPPAATPAPRPQDPVARPSPQRPSRLLAAALVAAILAALGLWWFTAADAPRPAQPVAGAPAGPDTPPPDRPTTLAGSPAPATPAPEPVAGTAGPAVEIAAADTPAPGGDESPASAGPDRDTETEMDSSGKAELSALVEQLRAESARLAALQKEERRPPAPAREAPPGPAAPASASAEPPPATELAGSGRAGADAVPAASAPAANPGRESGLAAFAAGNFASALEQLLPLAHTGDPIAQYHVALLYRNGQGVLANNATALDWLRRSAWQNHADAQAALARLYADGIDGRRDLFLAYVWYLRAERNGALALVAERNDVESQLQPEQLPQAMALALSLSGPTTMTAAGTP